MKNVLLTINIFLFFSSLFAQGTDITGIVTGETWTSAGNPYRINSNVDVQSLVIEAGVEIRVSGNYKIRISGSLAATGTKTDSILFSGSGVWQGVHFDTATINSYMKYCRISGAGYGIRSTESEISISNTRIFSNTGNGIELEGGSVQLERCDAVNNGSNGLLVSANGKAVIYNSIFRSNTQNGLKTNNGVLDVRNSIVTDNAQGGIFLANAADSMNFENCTIVDNTGGPGIVFFGSTVIGVNSIIYFNDLSVGFASGLVTIDYSDIEDLASYNGTGTNNFDLDPIFAENETFTLSTESPCIDKGNPDSRFNDICFPPSLGNNTNDLGAYGGPDACLWYDPLVISPAILSFGNVSIGDTEIRSALFRNYRDTTITVNSLLLSGTDVGLFSVEMTGFVLPAFDSLRRDVQFSPQNAGNFSADMTANSSAGPELISLSGRGVAPNISVDPMNINFGNVRALESASTEIIVNNLGIGNLNITALSLESEYFILTSPPLPFTIAPFTSDTVKVEFTPDSSGVFSATLQILSNDPDESIVTIDLSGTGIAPKIIVASDTLDFGNVNVLSDTLVQFQVGNSGNDTLFVFSGFIIDPDTLFSLTPGQFPFSIVPGGPAQNLSLNFQPVSMGDFFALLRLQSNDPRKGLLDVTLSGTGTAPRLELDSDTLAMGEVVINAIKKDSIVISNTGNASLFVSWDNLENPAGVFSLLDPPNSVWISPAQSRSIHVTFAPQDTGIYTAVLPVFSNDADRDSMRIPITGTGIQPILSIATDSLDFGTVLILENADRSFDIANSGTGGLIIDTSFTAGGDTSAFSVLSDFPIIVPAFGSPLSITVRFRPPARGNYKDTLYVSSNDPDNILFPLLLKGRGSAPEIEITQNSILFNTTYVTETSEESLLVKNSGEGDLYLINAVFSKGVSSSFTLGFSVDSLVIPGQDSMYIQIRFEPAAGGMLSDSLILLNSDPSNNRIVVYLEGSAIYDISPAQVLEYASFDTLETGRSFNFEMIIRDNETLIQRVFLNIRNTGEVNFERLNLSQGDNNIWSIALPQERINIRGIEYYLQVFHGGTITNFGTLDKPKKKGVHIENYILPAQTLANKYQMISLPVNTQNQSLSALFSDDLGTYDNTEYRFFDWDSADSAFVELSDMSTVLKPGSALWLITRARKNLDLDNSLSVLVDSSYTISLKTGWNMFGTPFGFDVAWNSISDSLIQGGTVYFYDGDEWIFDVERLEPFRGYAVYATAPVSLQIPPQEAPPLVKSAVTVDDEWHIRIECRSGLYRDTYNFAGVRAGSFDGIDANDVYNPPSPAREIEVYLGQNLAADYRTPGRKYYEYNFTVVSRHNTNRINIVPYNLPDGMEWAVVSPQTWLKYGDERIIISSGVHKFILYVGNKTIIGKKLDKYKNLPLSYDLNQNFPNPFNPDTKIRFQLPRPARVTMEVYNLLGQKIQSLITGEILDTGYHEVEWDGRDVFGRTAASGIYFLHFYTEDFRKTIKMILQR